MSIRTALGAAFLLLQAILIVRARFVPSRYFCWAPFSSQTSYRISTRVGERELAGEEVAGRYHLNALYRNPADGSYWEENSIQHVMDTVQQYEESYGRDDGAQVILHYRVNGWEEQEWRYPP